ncbi:hypothetical protein BH11VER1_BH11VER1_25150 [soil metagenome]
MRVKLQATRASLLLQLLGAKESAKLPDAGRVTQFTEGLGFDLTDTFASDVEQYDLSVS